ncbi:MAG: PAS domain S-box protein [Bacteroidales bacterium]|nr:PAS domain S-box protein [Bacteroidales bacterium]
MQIQLEIESTNILNRELSELKNEYYQNDNNCLGDISKAKNNTKSLNQQNTDKRTLGANSNHIYYRRIVNDTKDYICLTDARGRIIEWSDGLSNITGIDKNAINGEYIWNIYNHASNKNESVISEILKLRETFLNCILTKRTCHSQKHKNISLIKTDNTLESLEFSISMLGKSKQPLLMIVFRKK